MPPVNEAESRSSRSPARVRRGRLLAAASYAGLLALAFIGRSVISSDGAEVVSVTLGFFVSGRFEAATLPTADLRADPVLALPLRPVPVAAAAAVPRRGVGLPGMARRRGARRRRRSHVGRRGRPVRPRLRPARARLPPRRLGPLGARVPRRHVPVAVRGGLASSTPTPAPFSRSPPPSSSATRACSPLRLAAAALLWSAACWMRPILWITAPVFLLAGLLRVRTRLDSGRLGLGARVGPHRGRRRGARGQLGLPGLATALRLCPVVRPPVRVAPRPRPLRARPRAGARSAPLRARRPRVGLRVEAPRAGGPRPRLRSPVRPRPRHRPVVRLARRLVLGAALPPRRPAAPGGARRACAARDEPRPAARGSGAQPLRRPRRARARSSRTPRVSRRPREPPGRSTGPTGCRRSRASRRCTATPGFSPAPPVSPVFPPPGSRAAPARRCRRPGSRIFCRRLLLRSAAGLRPVPPLSQKLLSRVAFAYALRGQPQDARRFAEAALVLDPRDAQAREVLRTLPVGD